MCTFRMACLGLALAAAWGAVAALAQDRGAPPAGRPGAADKPAADPAVTRLIAKLKGTYSPDRMHAAQALGEKGAAARRAVPALVKAVAGDDDPYVRAAAAAALGQIHPTGAEALRALIAARGDRSAKVRLAAAAALREVRVGDKESLRILFRALHSEDGVTQVLAADALANAHPDAADVIPGLLAAFREGDAAVRRLTGSSLEKVRPASKQDVRVLLEALRDKKGPVREVAARCLTNAGPYTQEAVPALVLALGTPDESARRCIRAVLEMVGRAGPTAEPELRAALGHEVADVRRAAVKALGEIGPAAAKAVPRLRAALADRDSEVRAGAAAALGQVGRAAREAVPDLIRLLRDADPGLRQAAATALGRIGMADETVFALIQALKDRDSRVRRAAQEALAETGPATAAAVPRLGELFKDADAMVRAAAARAVGEIGPAGRTAVPLLRGLLRDPDRSVRQAAALALGGVGPEARAAVPDLAALCENKDGILRRAAARALLQIGPDAKAAVPALVALLADPDRGTAHAAAHALLAIGPDAEKFRPAFLRTVEGEKNPVRRAALLALAEVALAHHEAVPARLSTQRVGSVTYFRVTVKAPDDFRATLAEGLLPSSDEALRRRLAHTPRLVPQDKRTAAVYPAAGAAAASGPLTFVGKVRGDGPARLLLLYPSTRPARAADRLPPLDPALAPVAWTCARLGLDFKRARKLEPPGKDTPDKDNMGRQWAKYQARRFAVLEAQAPESGFYGVAREATGRKYGVPARPLGPAAGGRAEEGYRRLYETFTGAAALTESLARRRLLARGTGKRQERDVDLARVPGIDVGEHPWEKMMAGKEPASEPLAKLVPHDNYYVAFKNVGRLNELAGLLDQWGTNLIRAYEIHSRDYRLRERYERQLCLRATALARALRPGLVRGLALTGSDPYLREGSDVTVIFHVTDRKAFLDAVVPFLRDARTQFGRELKEAKGDYAGVAVESFVTPLREVSLHRAAVGDFVICSNSAVALRRVLDVRAAKRPALADALDFRYVRTVFRGDDKQEDGFAYLSDAFIRRLVGPASKIKEKRRLEALASLALATHGALFAGWETGRLPADHKAMLAASRLRPEEVEDPEGRAVVWDGVRRLAVSRTYNTLRFATPLIELPIDRVTEQEQRNYLAFRAGYLALWRRFFDPAALRLSLSERRVRLETYILPLIDSEAYSMMRLFLGGQPGTFDLSPTSSRALFQFVVGSSRDGRPRELSAVGDWALLGLDDSPDLRLVVEHWVGRRLRPSSKAPGPFPIPSKEDVRLALRLPLTLAVQVGDPKEFADLVKQVNDNANRTSGPATVEELKPAYRGVTITRIRFDPDSKLVKDLNEPDAPAGKRLVPTAYHAQVDGVWYLSLREESLRARIDQAVARRARKGGAKETAVMNASVYLAPRALDRARGVVHRYLEWESHRRAVGNGPLWYALYRGGALAEGAGAAAQEETALRPLGFVPVSPDGAPYSYDGLMGDVVNARHGSVAMPQLHPDLAAASPLRRLLAQFRTLRADLRFREDGVHTVLTIERKD